jgi:indole-3-glycerol phosphate synthase
LADKRKEVNEARKIATMEMLAERARASHPPRSFKQALRNVPFALIAEIKRASPSKGLLVKEFDHRELAVEFERGGASALSVLTDKKYFGGDPSFISQIKELVGLPILRKDFIIDEYQVYESRTLGADAILLIVNALSVDQLRKFSDCAASLGMAALVETHTEKDIETANSIGAEIIGINNRDLSSFAVSLETSLTLRRFIRTDAVAVSESGINSAGDMRRLREAGFQAALIGEGLVTRPDRSAALREFISG